MQTHQREARLQEAARSLILSKWRMRFASILSAFIMASEPAGFAQVNVVTYHYDVARTGVNPTETILTPANVNPSQFGKIFTQPVDGYVYAQPLVVSGVEIAGKGVHDVVFVATEHNSVYAFDAHDNIGENTSPLWHVNFGPSVPSGDVGSGDVLPEIGITSTPVIDLARGILYVVAKTKENSEYFQRLHALNISSGAEQLGSPVLIEATVPGTGDGSVNGQLSFNTLRHMNRPGLLLLAGVVYVAFASHGDVTPYHGWVFGYDATDLHRVTVFNTTPNGLTDPSGDPIGGGGIWQAGGGPAADADGNIYVITGNGTFSAHPLFGNGIDYGDSFIKLGTANGLAVADFFTPFNQDDLNRFDIDLGSSGAVVLPDSAGSADHPHLLIGAGKEGTIYLLDRDNMGGFTPGGPDNIVQTINFQMNGAFGSPAFFNGTLYYNSTSDSLKAFRIVNGQIDPPFPISQAVNFFGFPGGTPSVSANGVGDGIVWIIDNSAYAPSGPTVLHAYDATDLTHELYNSAMLAGRDTLGPAVKFTTPTIANGKVYVGAQYELNVLGLANFTPHRQITLTPDRAVNPIGTTHTVTAQVTDKIGFPRSGATVRFEIVAGPNAGKNSDTDGTCSPFGCQSDFTGNVQWIYVSDGQLGTDQIQASTPDPQDGTPQCAQVTKEWVIPPPSFAFPDFSSSQGLSLVGNTRITDNRLSLTPDQNDQRGAAWFSLRQPVVDGFDTTFEFQISDSGNSGAHGFAFVIQNDFDGPSALGGGGGQLGYSFLFNAVAVEFDTWFNSEFFDPNENHISVHTAPTLFDFVFADETFSRGSTTAIPELSDGNVHTVRISYEPGDLKIFLDDLSVPVLIVALDLGALLNLDNAHAWVGFTAATGGASESHDILSWKFNRTLREICTDGLDNDANGLIDGDDPECQKFRAPLRLSLSPNFDSGILGPPYTVTARITDADGNPQPGIFVGFEATGANFVTSGQQSFQNLGCTAPNCLTDSNGEVQWTYLAAGFPGIDFINAFAYDVAHRVRFEGFATKEWLPVTPPPPGNGNGLLGVYYDNIDFTGPSITRIERTIDFFWGDGSPDPAIEPDTFSVRWTGLVQPQFSEIYTFAALTDDGFRLWIDDQLVIDSFIDQPPTYRFGTIPLVANKKYKIQIDYYENAVGAVAQLSWSSPSVPFSVIPQSQLYSSSCSLTCPKNIEVCNDAGICGAVVNYPPPTSTGDCGEVKTDPPSGSIFPVGSRPVTLTASDGSTCTFLVIVRDCEPPKVTCSVETKSLKPSNHDLVNVGFKFTVEDNCETSITGSNLVVQVFSDEDESAPGSGNFSPDAKDIGGNGTLQVRAERSGGRDGRVYLIVATATDRSGNTAFCTSAVTVPHDQSAKSIAAVTAEAKTAESHAAANKGAPPPGWFRIGSGGAPKK